MDIALFVAELRHRLGIPVVPSVYGILDTLSLYANPSMAGGQKIFRHTAVRDTLYLRKSVRDCCSHRDRRI